MKWCGEISTMYDLMTIFSSFHDLTITNTSNDILMNFIWFMTLRHIKPHKRMDIKRWKRTRKEPNRKRKENRHANICQNTHRKNNHIGSRTKWFHRCNQSKDSRKRRNSTRSTTIDICRKTIGRRQNIVRLQHSKRINTSSCLEIERWILIRKGVCCLVIYSSYPFLSFDWFLSSFFLKHVDNPNDIEWHLRQFSFSSDPISLRRYHFSLSFDVCSCDIVVIVLSSYFIHSWWLDCCSMWFFSYSFHFSFVLIWLRIIRVRFEFPNHLFPTHCYSFAFISFIFNTILHFKLFCSSNQHILFSW